MQLGARERFGRRTSEAAGLKVVMNRCPRSNMDGCPRKLRDGSQLANAQFEAAPMPPRACGFMNG